MEREAVEARIQQLSGVRDLALLEIIKLINSATDAQRTHDQTANRLLKLLADRYVCNGFDGSSVDQ